MENTRLCVCVCKLDAHVHTFVLTKQEKLCVCKGLERRKERKNRTKTQLYRVVNVCLLICMFFSSSMPFNYIYDYRKITLYIHYA